MSTEIILSPLPGCSQSYLLRRRIGRTLDNLPHGPYSIDIKELLGYSLLTINFVRRAAEFATPQQ